jgi:hypothetical protein
MEKEGLVVAVRWDGAVALQCSDAGDETGNGHDIGRELRTRRREFRIIVLDLDTRSCRGTVLEVEENANPTFLIRLL